MIHKITDGVLKFLGKIGAAASETSTARLRREILVATSLVTGVSGIIWGVSYLALNEPLAANIPLIYALLSFLNLALFYYNRQFRMHRFVQLLLLMFLPFGLMWVLGGFIIGSAVMVWAFLVPVFALLLAGRNYAIRWFVVYVALVVFSGILQPALRVENNLSRAVLITFFVVNITAVSTITFLLLAYFVRQRDTAQNLLRKEKERTERLLLNVLPKDIVEVLKDGEHTIADAFDEVSVLFADVVGFTPLSEVLTPRESVEMLNEIFSYFDSLAEKHSVEKIRTIGDGYMVAAGVPRSRKDHAQALAKMALDMKAYMQTRPRDEATMPLQIRIGMNSGPAVAGIIGTTKFHYDLWGDSVNTAARMESHGEPGKIQIALATHELIRKEFICEPRGRIPIKGKGELETWFLISAS